MMFIIFVMTCLSRSDFSAELRVACTMTEPRAISSSKEDFAAFLHGLSEFRTPIETISELPKHEKVDANGSWTEAEMESELLYWVQLYLTHL